MINAAAVAMAATLTQQQQPSPDFVCKGNFFLNFTNLGRGTLITLIVLTFGVWNQPATSVNLRPEVTQTTDAALKSLFKQPGNEMTASILSP